MIAVTVVIVVVVIVVGPAAGLLALLDSDCSDLALLSLRNESATTKGAFYFLSGRQGEGGVVELRQHAAQERESRLEQHRSRRQKARQLRYQHHAMQCGVRVKVDVCATCCCNDRRQRPLFNVAAATANADALP